MTTAVDLLVDELKARDVAFVATLNGYGLNPFYLACDRAGMRVIDVRNEQAAGYMAEVAGRLSRSVGVCAVSGGVAHANAMTGVLNAWFDGAPMLLITGITPLKDLGRGNFQDFDPVPMARSVCKYARLLDVPERVPQLVHEAFAAASSGRPGPVHLALPLDVASAEVDPDQVVRSQVRSGSVRPAGNAAQEKIDEIVTALRQAERPVLVAGSGVYYARGEHALAQFVKQQQIPTFVPIWDRGSVNEPLNEFMGVVGAASGGPDLFTDTDLLFLAGAEIDYRVRWASPPGISRDTRVVRIDADPSRLCRGTETQITVNGSPATVLEQLTEACRQTDCPPVTEWLTEARRRKQVHYRNCVDAAAALAPGTNGKDVVLAIREVADNDALLLVDGGNIGQWFHQFGCNRYPGHWVTCGASGVVGWGLPGAMAARALYPDRQVILLSGDGSFTFTLGELECASRQGLHFVAVVADDERWGISATGHIRQFGRPLYSTLGPTRLDQVAEGLGCRGRRVEDREQLVPTLREALNTDAVTVVHVPIVPGSPAG